MFKDLYKCYIESDCSLLEINPLVSTTNEEIIALDAKVDIDSNSLFRHPEIIELRDLRRRSAGTESC